MLITSKLNYQTKSIVKLGHLLTEHSYASIGDTTIADDSCDLEFITIRVDFRTICFLSTLLVYAAADSFCDVVHTLSFGLENWTEIWCENASWYFW